MKRINKRAILNRLNTLEQNMKVSKGAKCISLEEWLNSDDSSKNFSEYYSKYKNAYDVILIDDISLSSDLYIDTSIILSCSKEDVKQFVDLINDPVEYMRKYITVFNDFFDIPEMKPREYYMQTEKLSFLDNENVLCKNGRYLTPEECRENYYEEEKRSYERSFQTLLEIFKEHGAVFYVDFMEHYTVMTAEELVNRYKQIEMHKLLEMQLETVKGRG